MILPPSHIVDKAIPDRARYLNEMAAMFRLGVACIIKDPQERPAMSEVLCYLRKRGRWFGVSPAMYQLCGRLLLLVTRWQIFLDPIKFREAPIQVSGYDISNLTKHIKTTYGKLQKEKKNKKRRRGAEEEEDDVDSIISRTFKKRSCFFQLPYWENAHY